MAILSKLCKIFTFNKLMDKNFHILRAIKWIIPSGLVHKLSYKPDAIFYFILHWYKLYRNRDLKDKHLGKRCFVMANGPSILKQDILKLKGEIVISISNAYLHSDYKKISPLYHIIPNVTYANKDAKDGITEKTFIKWIKHMQNKTGGATLLFNYTEHSIIKKNGLLTNNDIKYLCMGKIVFPTSKKALDLSGIIPAVNTSVVMAIMVAMYLGCKEIYLLGVDHDWFIKKEYKYFTKMPILKKSEHSTLGDSIYETCIGVLSIWKQYRALKLVASNSGIKIFNATHGGALDEFERVKFKSLF